MTDAPDLERPPADEPPRREIPDLRLRPSPPRVVRLSRKAIGVLGAAVAVTVGGLLIYALQASNGGGGPELYATDARPGAERLADAPRDYSQIPRLGPPLPGDLGRPIVSAQQRGETVPTPPIGAATPPGADPVEAARQRAEQERETARISQLFFASAGARAAAGGDSLGASLDALARLQGLPGAGAVEGAAPAALRGFLDREPELRTTSAQRLSAPVSPYVLQAGSVIPAALITGVRSDLPGQITAQVTQNVYDSPTGRILLVPQGARLIGSYDSEVSFGQRRVLLAWDRLILPDGRSIVLERQPGADVRGFSGLEDGVDHHWGNVFRAALISTVLGVGTELASDDDDALIRAIREGTQDTFSQTGQQIVRRELNVRPTLSIRPGHPVRVIVTRDLVLEPIGGGQ